MSILTAQQSVFVSEYLVDRNGKQAAIRAGYSAKTAENQASRLLSNVKVQEAIDVLLKQREARTLVTADYVIESIKNVAERCMQAEPVLDREGNPTGEYKFDSSGANRSLELLGKHLKLFTDKTELSGDKDRPVEINVNIVEED
jgi:phage terminase small subunit